MLKTNAGEIIGTAAPVALAPEAVSVETAARLVELGRSTLYKALHPDPGYRDGLPHLASVKVGNARRIRVPTLRAWLSALETTTSSEVV